MDHSHSTRIIGKTIQLKIKLQSYRKKELSWKIKKDVWVVSVVQAA